MVDKDKGNETNELLAGGTSIIAAASVAPPGQEKSAALAAAAPIALGWLVRAWDSRRERRRSKYLALYLAGQDVDDEAEIQAILADPSMHEIVFDALRVLDDAMLEEAVYVMAQLARSYRREGRRADWFSRGVRRIMQDIGADEFAALREVLTILDGVRTTREEVSLAFKPERSPPCLDIVFRDDRHAGQRIAPPTKADTWSTTRALERMQTSFMVRGGAAASGDGISGGDHVMVPLATVRRLLSLLPPPETDAG